jgi:exodeoxyribonuclease V gamma subunit
MPLNIYTGNRMENLVAALADHLKGAAAPLTPETIVVQSRGMQRWLAMELAKRLGVWANCTYPFPNAIVWRLFSLALPNIPETAPPFPDVLAWKVMKVLGRGLEDEGFAALRHYLAGDSGGLKRYQLAKRIADVFDQYTVFRPDMVAEWETAGSAGGECGWQAILWREVVAGTEERHRGRLKEEFRRYLMTDAPLSSPLPERISVFGVSYLPKYHLEILAAVARKTVVNLYLLSPTREYWSDIMSRREKARLRPEESALRVEGNPLLASLGKLGRDFSDMVVELAEGTAAETDLYEEPGEDSLLHQIQSDILNLSGAEEGVARVPLDRDDHSVQIHSCHSPMREIEVLHDHILSFLDKESDITPRDIVVMTPDIETYAPYITAVFDGDQDPSVKIPYSIADRCLRNEGRIAPVLLKLLDLPGSRFTAVLLFDILGTVPVKKRFGLGDEDLDMIRGWLENTSIRWGIDEQTRIRLGLPAYRENSWRAGLDRLLLGYAMTAEGERLFLGLLPYDEIEGAPAQVLGRLIEFVNKIDALADNLLKPRRLDAWRRELLKILDDFMAADDETAREIATINATLAFMAELGEQAGFDEQVELKVVRAWLTERLDQEEKGLGFMTGGVTFCAMLPMRSIPFRVVALIGMNDGAFPRRNPSLGFDLIARKPERGDRSLRDEDRYLFLEAILSARDCLYISYVGRSIKDNSELPPSVLVSELIDTIDRGFTAAGEGGIPERLVTRHPLQAFSRRYFSDASPLFSYASDNYQALLAKEEGPRGAVEFLTVPLPDPGVKDVSLWQLVRFFENPARYFLENRLKIRCEDFLAPLGEREPFSLDGLTAYELKEDLLDIALEGGDPRDFLPVARSRGMIPPARHGEILFTGVCVEVDRFAKRVQKGAEGENLLPPLDVDLAIGDFRLDGRLDGIRPSRMIRYRCAKLKAKDVLRGWIEHLALNAVSAPGYPRQTLLIMMDQTVAFAPVDDSRAVLETFLAMYGKGLTLPLRFFPAAALAYAEDQKWDLKKAYREWEDGYNIPGEGRDPYFRLCFGRDPFNEEFESVARTLLVSLVRHRTRHKT